MAVTNRLWWSVWWPWMLLWVATVLAVLVAVSIWIADSRAHGRLRTGRRHIPAISFYLDDKSVMDLYLQGDYKPALRQEVQENVRSRKDASISAKIYGADGKAGKSVNREIFRKWIEEAEPIAVIGAIMDVLERANVIVDVDLKRRHIIPNKALDNARKELFGIGKAEASPVRLSDLGRYVSVMGQFKKKNQTEDTTIFVAPYGDSDNSGRRPHVRVTCDTKGLRTRITSGTFRARCLGVVEEWDPHNQELVLRPIAIFQ